ncbi:hypothetical protein Q5P01_016940 [Channa striata]|uniref:Uncharacterized protein n=1 Tax=Channa striata TaxID=64152 RepID=A0AA88MCF6_CHASR|nr:hypothetical protein Q5P01_016940 [Channa striata]
MTKTDILWPTTVTKVTRKKKATHMAPERNVTDKGQRGALRDADGDAVWRISLSV